MTSDLQQSIEDFIKDTPGNDGWFTEQQIVEQFKLPDDRFLRANGSIPGPLSRCTIFSGRGVKHLSRATKEEIAKCEARINKSHTAAANKRQWLREGIARVLDGEYEKHSGQKVAQT